MTRPPQPREYGVGPKPPQPVEYGQARSVEQNQARPSQPVEYGAAPRRVSIAPRPTIRKTYTHPVTGEPLTGLVRVFDKNGTLLAALGLVDGVFELNLAAGTYHLIAEVEIDGITRYRESTETVGRYT